MLLRCTKMPWNAQEVYFITSGEVPSCTNTFFLWKCNIFVECQSVLVGFGEMAHCAGQMCILKYVFMEWHTYYCAGRNFFMKWQTTVLAWFSNRNSLKYTRNILDNIGRICQLQQWNGTLHCAGRVVESRGESQLLSSHCFLLPLGLHSHLDQQLTTMRYIVQCNSSVERKPDNLRQKIWILDN